MLIARLVTIQQQILQIQRNNPDEYQQDQYRQPRTEINFYSVPREYTPWHHSWYAPRSRAAKSDVLLPSPASLHCSVAIG